MLSAVLWNLLLVTSQAERPPAMMVALRVDALLAERWKTEGIQPAVDADGSEFLRRASLDLTGVIPTISDVRDFLSDSRADKRSRWIDRFLARSNHPTHLARVWRSGLLPAAQRRSGLAGLETWLREEFAANVPYDQVARDVLTATGTVNGRAFTESPAPYFTALEFKPEELATYSSRFFLAVQIDCAQCHDHPFDHWKQQDFWGYAAFFARAKRPPDAPIGFSVVTDVPAGDLKLPGTDNIVSPRYLGGELATETTRLTRREQLATWVTAPGNAYFARATVNRVWAHLFGRGLFEPVDDFRTANSVSHPQLLDELARYFIDSGFNLRELFRALCNTRAYQLSSETPGDRQLPPDLFACMTIKTLTADQLFDCLAEATRRHDMTSVTPRFVGDRRLDPARQAFLDQFQSTAPLADFKLGIPQALMLMNGQVMATSTDLARSDLLVTLDAPFLTAEGKVETLFLSTLSRLPREEERKQFVGYLQSSPSAKRRQALGDMLWALLNSAEFVLNH
jgi:hypothetical protein